WALVEPGPSAAIHRTIKLGERSDFIGIGVAFSPTPSAALRYWNMARQRYCRPVGAILKHPARLCRPGRKATEHSRAEGRGSRPSKAVPGERQTLRWRKPDS